MTNEEIINLNREYVFFSWSTQSKVNPLCAVRSEGVYFWDADGKRYLDFSSQLMNVNIGHGHPMRPEYLLTDDGLVIGEHCLSLARLVRQRKEADLAFRKWTLPLVAAIGGKVRRFHEVRDVLLGATPRAVTIGLKSLLAQRWATRILIDDYPPATGYELRPKGQRILTCVSGLY